MTIDVQINLSLGDFSLCTDLSISSRGITGIFGESGTGKTTLARAIAGLETNAVGLVCFDGIKWQDTEQNIFVPTHERRVGFVFQESVLFPHLNVRDNLRFGYHRRPNSSKAIDLDHIVNLFDLSTLLERDPSSLSGGEVQRAVIAQVILGQPNLLIMDEPMTGLDHRRRKDAVLYIEKLHSTLNIPILYITHSLRELERLITHMVILSDGKASNVKDVNYQIGQLKREDF